MKKAFLCLRRKAFFIWSFQKNKATLTTDRLVGMFETDQPVCFPSRGVPMTKPSTEMRDLLLQAAIGLLLDGEGPFTLDAVAKRSKVSKGGLIHHFPTKEALIQGVIQEIIRKYTLMATQMSRSAEVGTLEETRGYIDSSLEPSMRQVSSDLARGLIRLYGSDFRKDAEFLDPWRDLFASRIVHLRSKGDLHEFAKAAIVTLVIESFVMIDVFKLLEFSPQELEAIKSHLLEIASR